MPNINPFDTYYLAGIAAEVRPEPSFFLDRYFGESEAFTSNKVLVEFQDGDQKMAPFVDPNVGDIPVARDGYKLLEFEAPKIAPSRIMTIDDLTKRGFGEALLANKTPAQRAQALLVKDMQDLTKRIKRREEWMAVQAITTNSITCQEYVDDKTTGRQLTMYFYDTSGDNPGTYTVSSQWSTFAAMQADVEAMCDDLAERGLPAEDLILGATTWATVKQFSDLQALLDKRHEYIGDINARIIAPGVSHVGVLDFNGYRLNVLVPREKYINTSNQSVSLFDKKAACVTAPGCGKRYYAAVTQYPYGSEELVTFTGERIPKLVIDQNADTKKLRLTSRPVTAPKNKAPWIYAASVVS